MKGIGNAWAEISVAGERDEGGVRIDRPSLKTERHGCGGAVCGGAVQQGNRKNRGGAVHFETPVFSR